VDPKGRATWLLDAIGGDAVLLCAQADGAEPELPGLRRIIIGRDLVDREGHFARRFDASPGAAYLVRPDQHLAARWRVPGTASLTDAARRMRGTAT
jgi:3-(3-hydroxy-phenyl)propionate hydroxylase